MPPAPAIERPAIRIRGIRILAALLMASVLPLSACLYFTYPAGPEPESPIVGFDAQKFQVEKLTAALTQREKSLDTMQTQAIMEYTGSDQKTVKAKEQLVVKRPDNLRVEAMSPFGVALLLAAQGPDLAIYEPGENRFMRGAANAETLYRFARIPMDPADAVGLLMGLAPREFGISKTADSVSNENGMTLAAYGNSTTGVRQLGFSGGNLAMVRDTESGGQVRYEVRYSDYHDIGGVMFPYVVDADFPSARSHLRLRYLRPIVNGSVPESAFVLTPVPGATLMNLSMDPSLPAENES
ncbi:MAG: DUF4292 domain-containing protein [Candidatus Binatus sp.]|uniref:LolA family protein n=1 Tax=Candidatus Binatus sp. TaxID=2811406 RepID=UPI0027172F6E|nr:DUF4292 domain-containing protein [Candidatus Binatus sp.]MDO8434680.1 DUF4292 domain-containing protein [Candidatus Binatus sp.]